MYVESREVGGATDVLDRLFDPVQRIHVPFGHLVQALVVDAEAHGAVALLNEYHRKAPPAVSLLDHPARYNRLDLAVNGAVLLLRMSVPTEVGRWR